MDKHWMPLQGVPAGGSTFRIDDQVFWQGLLDEFGLSMRILDPLDASITVLPQTEGVLFRGRIRGRISMPCDRCSNDSVVSLDHSFDSFESFPRESLPVAAASAPDSSEEVPEETDEAVIRLAAHGKGVEVNPAALAWEEFSLALPVKPLCAKDCKGLCPSCGGNRNTETCSCDTGGKDPRMAVLRGLTIQKK